MNKLFLIPALLISMTATANDLVTQDMLDAHNTWRKKVGTPALAWSAHLQTQAQAWANELKNKGCAMKHSDSKSTGENIFWASSKKTANSKDANGEWIWNNTVQTISPLNVIDIWGSEQQWYTLETNECNAPSGDACGHYTQVVWKKTTEVGCAKAICDDSSQVWVCNYSPAGNFIGEKPY
ncbi:MAG: CAP domain-containing protein [Methylococcales bacterium]|nr:CAP domain-containing protein [Methylococcales bacterium]